MEKPDKKIKFVWIGEAFFYVVFTIFFALGLMAYLSYFLKINLLSGVSNEALFGGISLGVIMVFSVISSIWASLRYKQYGYILGEENLAIQDGFLMSQNHVVPYTKIEKARVANGGVLGFFNRLVGLSTVAIVTNDQEPMVFHIQGVSKPDTLIGTVMNVSRFGQDSEEEEMGLLKEIDAVRKAEKQEREYRQHPGYAPPAQPTVPKVPTHAVVNGIPGKNTLKNMVEANLNPAGPVREQTYLDLSATGTLGVSCSLGCQPADEMIIISTNRKPAPKKQMPKEKKPKQGKTNIKGLFSKRKDKKTIDDIIEQ